MALNTEQVSYLQVTMQVLDVTRLRNPIFYKNNSGGLNARQFE